MRNIIVAMSMLACTFSLSCDTGVEQKEPEKATEETRVPLPLTDSLIATKHFIAEHKAGSYSFFIDAENGEITAIHIRTKGLPYEYDDSLEVEGRVRSSFMLDLNNDGYREFYLCIAPTDDSGNINIEGFASNRDRSISRIHVEDTRMIREVGTDRVFTENGQLRRALKSNGEAHLFTFMLQKGETGFVLKAMEN